MSSTIKTKHDFQILPINTNDKSIVIEFLLKFFFWDEPLNATLELMKEDNIVEILSNHAMQIIDTGKL